MRIYTKPENYYDPARGMQTLEEGQTLSSGIIIDSNLKYVMAPGEWVLF